ncbi:MAG: DNA methyltransferase [Thermoanaerobaculia bacterium]
MNSSPLAVCEMTHDVLTDDSLLRLPSLAAQSFDAVITDPPYEMGLHGIAWDTTGISYNVTFWRTVWRVLKPGAHLLAFGAPRTYHRMACAIEDAGFEIRDSLHWIFGNGFPKGSDIAKTIDRRRNDRDATLKVTAFLREGRDRSRKTNGEIDAFFGYSGMASHWCARSHPAVPTMEQWVRLKVFLGLSDEMDAEVARLNARKGTPGENWQSREVTGLHSAPAPGEQWRTRLGAKSQHVMTRERRDQPASDSAREWRGWTTTLKPAHEPIVLARKPVNGSVADNVLQFRTGALNTQATRIAGAADVNGFTTGRCPTNVLLSDDAARELDESNGNRASRFRSTGVRRANRGGLRGATSDLPSGICYADSGGPSRFFYVARASPSERRAGLAPCDPKHPTVKPIALMRHLVRLVTPPGGVVLDPFTGTGTTGVAVALEGASFVGIERDPAIADVARKRINHWKGEPQRDEQRAA